MAVERKINGVVYRCDKLPASDGLKLFKRVMHFFRAAPAMVESVARGSTSEKAASAFLVLALADDSEGDQAHDLLVDLAQSCFVGTDPCVVGVKPASMEDLIAVAWFAMEVNFKDFLAASLV